MTTGDRWIDELPPDVAAPVRAYADPHPPGARARAQLAGQAVLALVSGWSGTDEALTSAVDDLVVNMVDVGEETGELDTMLYKVADTYDEEVAVLTDGLTKLMEPLLILFLGGAVGFIVIALFVPLVDLINNLSG